MAIGRDGVPLLGFEILGVLDLSAAALRLGYCTERKRQAQRGARS
jgi:hypothetical protein